MIQDKVSEEVSDFVSAQQSVEPKLSCRLCDSVSLQNSAVFKILLTRILEAEEKLLSCISKRKMLPIRRSC